MEFENLDLATLTVLDEDEMELARKVLKEGKEAKARLDELIRVQGEVRESIERYRLTLQELKNGLSVVHLDWVLTGKRRQDFLSAKKKALECSDLISDNEVGLELIDREIFKTRVPIERAVRLADKVNRRLQDERERAEGTAESKLFVTV